MGGNQAAVNAAIARANTSSGGISSPDEVFSPDLGKEDAEEEGWKIASSIAEEQHETNFTKPIVQDEKRAKNVAMAVGEAAQNASADRRREVAVNAAQSNLKPGVPTGARFSTLGYDPEADPPSPSVADFSSQRGRFQSTQRL